MCLVNFLVAYSLHFHLQTVEVQEWMIFAEEYYPRCLFHHWTIMVFHQTWICKERFSAHHFWVLKMFRGLPQKTNIFQQICNDALLLTFTEWHYRLLWKSCLTCDYSKDIFRTDLQDTPQLKLQEYSEIHDKGFSLQLKNNFPTSSFDYRFLPTCKTHCKAWEVKSP